MIKHFAIAAMMMPAGLMAATAALALPAPDTLHISQVEFFGPFEVTAPLIIDSLDVNSKAFEARAALDGPMGAVTDATPATLTAAGSWPASTERPMVGVARFKVENTGFARPTLHVEGLKDYRVTVDGQTASGQLKLKPATHTVEVKYFTDSAFTPEVKIYLTDASALSRVTDGKRRYSLSDVLHGSRIGGVSVSADGRWAIVAQSATRRGGSTEWSWQLMSLDDGRTVSTHTTPIAWMPSSSRYYLTRPATDGRSLVSVDPATGAERVEVKHLPEGHFAIAPDERHLIITNYDEGPKEDPQIYQVLEPDDRQPGWRTRGRLSLYDTATGRLTPLTHGHSAVRLMDISDDSRHALIGVTRSRLEKRPATVTSILSLDLTTLRADTIVADDGFIGGAVYSPDGRSVLVSGSPESMGGIGNVVPEGRIPSMYDMQLYLVGADRSVTPLTRDFDPSVGSFEWSRADGKVYFLAEDRDCVSLFRLDPAKRSIERLPAPEELLKGIALPRKGTRAALYGESAGNPGRLHAFDTRTLRSTVLAEPQKADLADVKLGVCRPFSFLSSRGDSIHGRYYLPCDFDPSRSYPMIVNYYGGCSPTSRNFESRYPHHAYAAQGYVVYVVEPSGATGFGQEFSSRHVKTAGQGVADDIIEGTRRFVQEHPWVDSTRIGCIGASYGGFMTMYLQTVTPMFAAAVSHAGISDHTSYWGFGYWGYSYSQTSMGDAYPWTHPDLYVKQSPLFRADKVTTPLLFVHGDSDTNVPLAESVQMFTALKLLGRETALVAVTGQDHHIMDYEKRIKWQDTIFAWFEKYLKGDSTWWDTLYPPKSL